MLGADNGPYSNYYNRRADYSPEEDNIEYTFVSAELLKITAFRVDSRWPVFLRVRQSGGAVNYVSS